MVRFSIKKEIWSKIPAYADYGFAVFQLKALSGTLHPIAFEFDTRLRDTLFFPTIHIHDGTVHAEDAFDHISRVTSGECPSRASNEARPSRSDGRRS